MPMLELPDDFPLANFVTEVSENDGMFGAGWEREYLNIGLSALRLLHYAIDHAFLPASGPQTILDFACGHGRIARVLRSRFPAADLTVCDIDRDGVDFCARQFAATAVCGSTDFDSIPLEQRFDLIWVGSLITHLDQNDAVKFIRCMERHLTLHGLLMITSHGSAAVQSIRSGRNSYGLDKAEVPQLLSGYDLRGYSYADYPNTSGYGVSLISRHWIEGLFAGATCSIVAYLEQGWHNHHDVLFLKRRAIEAPDASRYEAELARAYWRRYPDVAGSDYYGERGRLGHLGAWQHFEECGRNEGRTWRN